MSKKARCSSGDIPAPEAHDRAALALRDRLAGRAGAALLVVDATAPVVPATELPVLALVVTKCDLPRADLEAPRGLRRFEVSNRVAAYMLGVDRVAKITKIRGLYA